MTVDKFGHYYNQKYIGDITRNTLSKNFGITFNGNNIDIENKRILNLSPPINGADAVNKHYVNTQITHMQEHLKRGINKEVLIVRNEIKDLNKIISDIYSVMITLSSQQQQQQQQHNGKKNNNK